MEREFGLIVAAHSFRMMLMDCWAFDVDMPEAVEAMRHDEVRDRLLREAVAAYAETPGGRLMARLSGEGR